MSEKNASIEPDANLEATHTRACIEAAQVHMHGQVLVAGSVSGTALVLPEPLSLWGGLDPVSGEIIDRRHPCSGAVVTGRVLVLPAGRGSSSASSVLLESVRVGTAPAAILTLERDAILALGAAVSSVLYKSAPPILVLSLTDYSKIRTGQHVQIQNSGEVTISAKIVSGNSSNTPCTQE